MEVKEKLLDGLEIRTFTPEDYPQVRKNMEEAGMFYESMDSEDHFLAKHQRDPNSILVAEYKGQIVGSALLVEDGWVAFGFRLNVRKDFRNKGIATRLMEGVERLATERGYPEFHILVDEREQGLQGMYERKGFKKGGLYRWMAKKL